MRDTVTITFFFLNSEAETDFHISYFVGQYKSLHIPMKCFAYYKSYLATPLYMLVIKKSDPTSRGLKEP